MDVSAVLILHVVKQRGLADTECACLTAVPEVHLCSTGE